VVEQKRGSRLLVVRGVAAWSQSGVSAACRRRLLRWLQAGGSMRRVVFAGGNRWRRRRRRCRRLGERSRRAVRRRADKEAAEAASSRAEPSGRPATAGVWNLDAVILRLSSFLVVRWAARRGRGVCLSQKTVLGGAWDGGLVGV
jgi:hypothetical protein